MLPTSTIWPTNSLSNVPFVPELKYPIADFRNSLIFVWGGFPLFKKKTKTAILCQSVDDYAIEVLSLFSFLIFNVTVREQNCILCDVCKTVRLCYRLTESFGEVYAVLWFCVFEFWGSILQNIISAIMLSMNSTLSQ